jgi:hypothetical protein
VTRPDPPDPPDLGPEDEETVRRLLAEAGGPLATPPEVRARLEETLADLVASRTDAHRAEPEAADPTGGGAVVTRLAPGRRRRWPALVAAAAALFAVGYGAATVVQQSGGGGGDTDSAGSAGQAEGGGPAADAGGGAVRGLEGTARAQGDAPGEAAPDVTGAFRGDPDAPAPVLAGGDLGPWALDSGAVVRAPSPGTGLVAVCAPPPTDADEDAYRVRFRGAPATMVLGPVSHGRRVAVVYGCASARPLDATVLRAR